MAPVELGVDLEHPYVKAMLGQRNAPSVDPSDTIMGELLRADSLWAEGKGTEALEVIDWLEKRSDWDAERFGSLAQGLRALVQGDLNAAYCGYAQAATQGADVFAGERAANIAFWMACAGKMLKAGSALQSVTQSRPFAGGVLAFAQHMTGDSDTAMKTAQGAIEKGFDDPWTLHAVAHSLYSLGKSQECARWLEQHRDKCSDCSTFMKTHMEFHLAMCLLDLKDADASRRLLDGALWGTLSSVEKNEYWAATGVLNVLWKAQLRGVDVQNASVLAQSALEQLQEANVFKSKVFSLCILRWRGPGEWLEKIKNVGDDVFSAVATAICAAYAEDNWDACADALAPVAERLHELGASPEQREVLEEFLAVAFVKTNRSLDSWLAKHGRPDVPWYSELRGQQL